MAALWRRRLNAVTLWTSVVNERLAAERKACADSRMLEAHIKSGQATQQHTQTALQVLHLSSSCR
eukprot:1039203-Pleurochrysis_carterae.AAC.5